MRLDCTEWAELTTYDPMILRSYLLTCFFLVCLLHLLIDWLFGTLVGSWSLDGGVTWGAVSRSPLLIVAHADSIVTTRSGVIVAAGRFPALALMVSYDDALTPWSWHVIDTSGFGANGVLIELEPDLVMYMYGGTVSVSTYMHVWVALSRVGIILS